MNLLSNRKKPVDVAQRLKGTGRFFSVAVLLVSAISIVLQIEVAPAQATTVTWSSSQSVPSGNWFALAFGNGRWTSVAQSGTNRLMTSADGVNWTTSGLTYNGANGGPVDGDWRAVRYANSMWLAAGYDGRVMTSSDGLAWSDAGVTGLTVNEDLNSVAYKTGRWVAVGAASTIMTSVDGLSWSNAGVTGVPSAINLRSIAWGSAFGRFVAVGDNSTVIYSSDGLTWSNANVTGIAGSLSLTYVASGQASNGNFRFVVVSPSNTSGSIWSSMNGESWSVGTANSSCTSSQRWNSVAYGNGRWVAVRGASGNCDSISSILGVHVSWEATSGGVISFWNAVAYGNGRWVAVGGSVAMSAAEPSLTPTLDTPVATADGFTVNVTNYNASYFWGSAPTVSAGTATWGTAVGANRPLTVSGLSAGASANVTVIASRSGFAPGSATVSGTSVAPPATLTPSTQTVSGTAGTAITSSTALTPSGFGGAPTYAVTSGSLPNGLQLDQSTGVVTGTPNESSSTSITITGTSGANTATATITFAIAAPASTTTLPPVTTTTTLPPAITTTTVPSTAVVANESTTTTLAPRPTPVASPKPGQSPALITSADAVVVSRQPGQVAALVNGQSVTATLERITNPAVSVPPANRNAEQVVAVQQAAAELVAEFRTSLSQNATAPVSVTNTATGAVINGLLVNPRNGVSAISVPIENVVMMNVGSARLLLVGASPQGDPLNLLNGTLRVGPGGILSVAMAGLPANAQGEAVLFSTPTLLGSFTTSAEGTFSGQFTVPSGMENGSHSLVLKVGSSTMSLGVQLDNSLSMPSTGIEVDSLLILVMLLLASGIFTRMVSRRFGSAL